ncbi:Guanylate cyclase domain-containing protein [Plasmodiophora brassicae]|nr:hypothetical protein PBRA_003734 [Plasmodiophora brassicae]
MSVLGKEFNLSLLSAVHPRVNYLQAIQQHLRDLVKEGYISIVSRSSAAASMSDDSEPQSSAPDIPLDAVISFTSELFRDVAYGTLLQEQQIEIHAAAFKYMLKDRETNKHSQYQPASLAYHAFCASMWQNALEFLEATIEECLERHAWAEALTHLGARMIILEKRLNEPRPKDALDTRFKIYQLNATIGEFDVALKSAIRCLELLKVRLPRMHRTLEFADPGIPTKIVESFNSLGVGSHKPIPKLAAKLVTVEQSGQEPTRRAVEILLDMQRSAMMAEHVDLNNLCVTSAANLCKTRLDDRTLLAYCYASCAYASRYVFESGDLGEAFRAKAEELLRPSRTEPSAYQLGALTMLAMFEASQGQWLHAIEMFSQTVDMYRTLDGGARTRDSKFSIAVIHHLRGRFETCLEELALLEDSMPAADDHFLLRSITFLKAQTMMSTGGASYSILELLDSAIGMNVGKMGHSNDLSVVVFREYVAFLLGDSAPASIVTFLNTFTEVQQKRRPIIWYDWPSRWYFGMLALSAAESVAVDGNSETFGHLVAHASYGVQLMAAFAACFPYALPLMLILKARLLFLQGNASEATAAALQASNTCSVTQLKFFGALSLIQLAKHAGCDEDKKGIVHQARLLINQCGVNACSHQEFFIDDSVTWTLDVMTVGDPVHRRRRARNISRHSSEFNNTTSIRGLPS